MRILLTNYFENVRCPLHRCMSVIQSADLLNSNADVVADAELKNVRCLLHRCASDIQSADFDSNADVDADAEFKNVRCLLHRCV